MPPALALILTLTAIAGLLWREARKSPQVSGALWLPVIWIFLVSSKFVGQWLATLGLTSERAVSMEDGSPIDAVVFLALIVAGAVVLARRGVTPGRIIAQNKFVAIFLLYCLISIAWSDFPLVALRRWVKVLGHPIMALVILSGFDPIDNLRRVIKRTAILYVPLSVLCLKYYPEIGRGFDAWTGQATNRGISHNKNELGYACLFFGLGLFWSFLYERRGGQPAAGREDKILSLALLALVGWLLMRADSATSLACLVLGVATIVGLGMPFVRRRFVWAYVIAVALSALAGETLFGISEQVFALLGRNSTLTDRTEVWADLMAMKINPIIGTGFESFWLGPRLEAMWARWWWQPNQAHNGYIETYLNLGWVGVALLIGVILTTFVKAQRTLLEKFDLGRFRMAWLFVILAYNYTEATFKGVHLLWTVFHIIALDALVHGAAQRTVRRKAAQTPPRFDSRGGLGQSA